MFILELFASLEPLGLLEHQEIFYSQEDLKIWTQKNFLKYVKTSDKEYSELLELISRIPRNQLGKILSTLNKKSDHERIIFLKSLLQKEDRISKPQFLGDLFVEYKVVRKQKQKKKNILEEEDEAFRDLIFKEIQKLYLKMKTRK
jgi:hypothetical protein